MARVVEGVGEIAARWREQGREFSYSDLTDEWDRQRQWAHRETEDEVLARAEQPDASEHVREVAAQIRDHRDGGNWTTWRREPAAPDDSGR
jgi:hypothetical protein